MAIADFGSTLDLRVRELVLSGFAPRFGELRGRFGSNPLWKALRALGTELWLDTGDIEAARALWTQEFTALTTNNTLLNKEVQKGTYDALIGEAARLLSDFPQLTDEQRKLEVAFILNARHGLRLVEEFDAFVSVEEHTDISNDLEAAVNCARRFHAVCPERFYVKIPLSPAGLLATRRVAAEGIPVNHTLGFSARQNYVIARIGRPAFVNVFMGRLNSFVADNGLGSGAYVGERATLASQRAVRELRAKLGIKTRQIGASFREAAQVRDLAGMDVMTIPPKVAQGFLDLGLKPGDLSDRTGADYQPPLNEGVEPAQVGLNTLWDIDERLVACLDEFEKVDMDALTPEMLLEFFDNHNCWELSYELEKKDLVEFFPDWLVDFFQAHACGDVLVDWLPKQVKKSAAEGKIPKLKNWRKPIAKGTLGLDALMNLAGWNSFDADQREMDAHVRAVLG